MQKIFSDNNLDLPDNNIFINGKEACDDDSNIETLNFQLKSFPPVIERIKSACQANNITLEITLNTVEDLKGYFFSNEKINYEYQGKNDE